MATTVSHQVPTTQQQAIAALTGYEDAATRRWSQSCVQAAQVVQAQSTAKGLVVEQARLARGLDLAQRGAVRSDDDDGPPTATSGKHGSRSRHGHICPCEDRRRHQLPCKHELAVEIHLGALHLSQPAPAEGQRNASPVGLGSGPSTTSASTASAPTSPAQVAPGGAGAQPTRQRKAAPAASAPQTRIDNPAGANLKFRIGPNELRLTWHASSDEALLARLRTTLPLFQEIVEACEQRYTQRPAATPPTADSSKPNPPPQPERSLQEEIAAAVQAAMTAHAAASSNG